MAQFDSKGLKKICVYTSGGDAPAMNAAIRSVVRTAIYNQLEVVGSLQGYSGLIKGNFIDMDLRSVANIIQRGGTILKSGRCPEFLNRTLREQAAENIRAKNIDAMVCIGGDGSFRGAEALGKEFDLPVVCIPGTIDNDINGCDATIGFDTAVNTALEAIDRIRDTAASHDRLFIVEVMGRDSGFIAVEVALAGGAEQVFIPENLTNIDQVIDHIHRGIERGKNSSILITAEGQKPGRAYDLAEAIRKKAGYDAKICILGHIQRGGAPTARDRILASRLGTAAVQLLMNGESQVMVGTKNGQVVRVDLAIALEKKHFDQQEMLDLIHILSN